MGRVPGRRNARWYSWLDQTLETPRGAPLLIAACIAGWVGIVLAVNVAWRVIAG